MILTFMMVVGLAQDSVVYSGRARRIEVAIPRIDTVAVIDGHLDEAVWSRAARLTDFSQYQPVDGRPAEDPTEVLVWYAGDAIYFGIKAGEIHGDVVRATQANRDNIESEDQIQILLDTYNDRRRAFLFGVNPLGVQQDGTRSDQFGGGAGGRFNGGGGITTSNLLDGNVDLNPDYVFESKGRLVPGGYEVEIRIPFKSLRYQEGSVLAWGLNVLRRVQHSGFQDSWTPAIRASASFLGQSGSLVGLRELHRGLVLELTPTATGRLDGSRLTSGRWSYDGTGDLGGDVRWGITQNLTLNGTLNPDFSQVEADVGQVLLNERFALFYPEKRPFFLDGLELFDSPNQLIYTRRIVAPDAGVKLAGKLGGTNVAALVAADGRPESFTGRDRPLFGAARIRTDLGLNSSLGTVLTTREDGPDFSRLAGLDLRLYHSRLYFLEMQAVQSWTADSGGRRHGSLLQADWDRTGRSWGFHYTLRALAPDFDAAVGFVNRVGIIDAQAYNRLTGYGSRTALVQTYGAFFGAQRIWSYRTPGNGPLEGYESVSPSATLRGGWQLSGSLRRSFFSYDPVDYAGFRVVRQLPAGADTAAFTVPGPERNQWSASLQVTTPTYRQLTATASVAIGEVPLFGEASAGSSVRVDAILDLRPTSALRTAVQFTRLELHRRRTGESFSTETIPRLKIEYQLSRAIFFRWVGQYTARRQAPLIDRDGNPILVAGVRDAGEETNELRADWLFSYRPTPGTLFYLGYGSTLEQPGEFRLRDLRRTTDGFFGKVSYLFRV
jgi:hypothetical protein